MRRALPPLLALVLALALLTGCEFSLERLAHGGALPPPPEDYTGLQDGFRYTKTTLTGQERYLYDQLLAGLQNQEETIGDLYPDTEMIQTAIDAIDRDYPELFWFSGTGQIETTLLAGKPLEAAYTPVYTMDQAQRQATQAQIDQWAADCFATIPQGASDYDKALGVFTYIIQHADYQVVDNNSIVNIMVRACAAAMPRPPNTCWACWGWTPPTSPARPRGSPTPGTWPGWTEPPAGSTPPGATLSSPAGTTARGRPMSTSASPPTTCCAPTPSTTRSPSQTAPPTATTTSSATASTSPPMTPTP